MRVARPYQILRYVVEPNSVVEQHRAQLGRCCGRNIGHDNRLGFYGRRDGDDWRRVRYQRECAQQQFDLMRYAGSLIGIGECHGDKHKWT